MCLLGCGLAPTVVSGLLEDFPSPPSGGETLRLERTPTGCAVLPKNT